MNLFTLAPLNSKDFLLTKKSYPIVEKILRPIKDKSGNQSHGNIFRKWRKSFHKNLPIVEFS